MSTKHTFKQYRSANELIQDLLGKFIATVEREFAEPFLNCEIDEIVRCDTFAGFELGTVRLRIDKRNWEDNDAPHRLDIVVTNITNHYERSKNIAEGDRNDILDKLKSAGIGNEIEEILFKFSIDFVKKGI